MQPIIAIVLISFMLAMGFVIFKMSSAEKSMQLSYLKSCTIWGEFLLFSSIFMLFTKLRMETMIVFTLYYIILIFTISYFFCFCMKYCGISFCSHFCRPVLIVSSLVSISLIVNIFYRFYFNIIHTSFAGHTFWIARKKPLFYIYLIYGFALIILANISLIAASIKSARLYQIRYVGISIATFTMFITYAFTIYKEYPYFLPILVFGAAEALTVYLALYYSPRQLIHKILLYVADKLNDGLIIYDENHTLVFVTDSFCEAFALDNTYPLKDEYRYWNEILKDTKNNSGVWSGCVKHIVRNGKDYYYEVQNKQFSENTKPIGTVYWIQDITEAIKRFNEVAQRAYYDELTGIYNEKHFHEVSRQILDENPTEEFLLMCSDFEKFRVFTDLFGTDVAESVLKSIAYAFERDLNQLPKTVYGRIDNDKFAILMPKSFFQEKILLDGINAILKPHCSKIYSLVLNIGIYEVKDRDLTPASMCNRALMACSSIRGEYAKRVAWYDESIHHSAILEEKYNAELSEAIASNQIKMYLQPQVNYQGKIVGAEALVRWQHPIDGLVPPFMFVPNFEKNGRITELDMFIWREACKTLKRWKQTGHEQLHISVNISPKDLYAIDIYEVFTSLIKEYDISPKNLKLEITESAIINDLKQHIRLIDRLHEAGFEIEMDDFGSAYSSFNMLKDLYVDVLKIDMKFLGDTENNERSESILESIVALSKVLKMSTVAEGVETKAQFDFLSSAGTDVYQGYYFSRPIPLEEFESKYVV